MSDFPTKRIGSGVLLRNDRGEILVVKPTYKPGWEIPGGLVEDGESPREAARRECIEELGVDFALGDPAVIHYAPGARGPGDGVMFVFDAGRTTESAATFELPEDELSEARFVPVEELAEFLPEVMVRRMRAAANAADGQRIVYLER